MKKNTKFLLMYVAILFSFALVLILFAGLTQNNYAKELANNQNEKQGIKQNLINVTEQHQALRDSLDVITAEYNDAKMENDDYKRQINALTSENQITKTLIEALQLYESGEYTKARNKIASINKEHLTETQLYIYNKIK